MSELERLWSVTTLLGAGLPKEALVGWAAKHTAEVAVRKRDAWLPMAEEDEQAAINFLKGSRFRTSEKAADRGTNLHAVIEALALGAEPPDHDLPHVKQIERFFAEHEPEFLLSEATVYNLKYRYAGTLDGVVRFHAGPLKDTGDLLFDAKTTDKSVVPIRPGAALPPYPEVALQMAAYRGGEYVGLAPPEMRYEGGRRYYLWHESIPHEPMPEVVGGVALAVFPDGFNLVPVDIGEDAWRGFLAAREVARWSLVTSKTVLSKPVVLTPDSPKEEAA